MKNINKREPASEQEIAFFLQNVSFSIPNDFLEFYRQSNGMDIYSDEYYTTLWSLNDIIQLNKDYNVDEFAPSFYIFGSDGGDTAFMIEKSTSRIFEMPFIGMSNEAAAFLSNTLDGFLQLR